MVTLHNSNYDAFKNDAPIEHENAPIEFTSTQRLIYSLIKENNDITFSEISLKIGKDISSIKRAVRKLKKEGVIKRVGYNQHGHWEIVSKELIKSRN